jgi:hypothetical protein
MQVIGLDEIPAMSMFMIRLGKKPQNGRFVLRRNDILTHGKSSHSTLRSTENTYNNEVVFRVSPESNPNIYDLAGIGLRKDGNPNNDKNDILKAGVSDNSELFCLYSVSEDGEKLSANIVPETTASVPLYLAPGSSEGRFRIEATRMESLQTGLWLEDLKEGTIVDLFQTEGSYAFDVSQEDLPGRFNVLFQPQAATDLEELSNTPLRIYYAAGQIAVKGLNVEDAGSRIQIVDVQGQLLQQATVTQTPEMYITAPLAEGVYIFRLEGKRVVTLKFKR